MENWRLAGRWLLFYIFCRSHVDPYFRILARWIRWIAPFQVYERKNIRFLAKLLKEGDIVVDVGANFGTYTFVLSRLVGSSGRVLAFEPLAQVFDLLKAHTSHLKNISLYHEALSDSEKLLKIKIPLLFGKIPDPALASVEHAFVQYSMESVRANTLDHYLSEIDRLSFIKVDVEGHEIAFLKGALKVIEKFRPMIQFESDLAKTYHALSAIAKRLDYRICRLNPVSGLEVVTTPHGLNDVNYYLVPASYKQSTGQLAPPTD